jgi:hypothetical protein
VLAKRTERHDVVFEDIEVDIGYRAGGENGDRKSGRENKTRSSSDHNVTLD